MELTPPQRKALHAALLQAFPTRTALARMMDFELGENLDAVAGDGGLNDATYALIVWMQSRGKLSALVTAARRDNPDNPHLRAFEESVVQARNQQPEDPGLRQFAEEVNLAPESASAAELEKIVATGSTLHDPDEWRRRQNRAELPVCLIEMESRTGLATGVLVAPDLVLTAYYAVEPFLQRGTGAARFDYRQYGDGTTLSAGQRYAFADDWLVTHSPMEGLDFALVRLEGRPGDDPVAGQAGAPPRRWVTPQPRDPASGDLLFIVQHALGGPLKIASGPVLGMTKKGLWRKQAMTPPGAKWDHERVVYSVHTEPGSGGAPVFASDWSLVALHELASSGGDFECGVPMAPILEHLDAAGIRLPAPRRD